MSSPFISLDTLRKNPLARNTGWMVFGQGFRLVIQGLYFAVIARGLGVANYGAFVGVLALVGILFPFANVGSGCILIKNVARDPSQFPKFWGRALLTTFAASGVLFAFVIFVSRFVMPAAIPLRLVMLVAASDLFGMSLTALCWQCFQAFERLHWTAAIQILLSTARLLAAILLLVLHHGPSALQWGEFYFGATTVAAVLAIAFVLVKLGLPHFNFSRTAADIREGFYFSASQSAQTIYNDIDKTMLTRLASVEATGIYGAAYRLIDVSFTPIASLLAAAYPSFFRTGMQGIGATVRYARPLIVRALGYSVLVCILLILGAGIVPLVLGPEYRLTEEALRWLAVLPLFKVIHLFLSDALTGAGHQGLRSAIQLGVAVFNILINLWIIPAYSWRGAAWSSIASDGLLACAIATAVFVLSRREPSTSIGAKPLEVTARA